MKKKSIFLGLMIAGASFFALSSCNNKKDDSGKSNEETVEKNESSISFETNGGTPIDVQVTEDGHVIKPADPSKESTEQYDFTFAGWYKDQLLTEPFDFENDTVNSTTTLYAKWDQTVREYTVTFVSTDGISTNQTVEYGSNATFPSTPTKGADSDALYKYTYEFDGWYDSNNTKYLSDTEVHGDVTLSPRFKVKTIQLNTTAASLSDVTNLVNDKYLSDVIAYEGYDMVTFFSCSSSSTETTLKSFSYYIDEKNNIIPVNRYVKSDVEAILGKYNIENSYIYLPALLAYNAKNNITYTLSFNGARFEYVDKTMTIYYDINGYIIGYSSISAIFDKIYEDKPNLKLIDVIHEATAYELYYESNPSRKYSCVYSDKTWSYSSSVEQNEEARFFLEQSMLTFSEVYDNMKRFGDFTARKENNYYICQFDGKERSFELSYDECGYLRKIVITIHGKTDVVSTIYSNPTSFEVSNKVKFEEFINNIFNSTNLLPGYFNADISEGVNHANIDYYYVDGKLLYQGPKIGTIIAEFIDPSYKNEAISSLLSMKNSNISFDKNTNQYIVYGTNSSGVTFELYLDSYGQPVKLIRKTATSTMTANITYDFGVYGKIIIAGATQEETYVNLSKPLTYIPVREGRLLEDGSKVENVFMGYYMDVDYKEAYDPNKHTIKAGMVIYAAFKEELHVPVIWHADPTNSSNVTTTYVNKDLPITPIASPNYEGYEFVGWYIDPDYKKEADFSVLGTFEFFGKFIPETYSDFIVIGNSKLGDGDTSIPSMISEGDFSYVGSIGVIGKIEKTEYDDIFTTTIYEQTALKFELDDYSSISYHTYSKSDSGAALLCLDTDIKAGQTLTTKYFYIKNGQLTICSSGTIAQEGVEYYALIASKTVDSGELVLDVKGLKAGTYVILQPTTTEFLGLQISYKK